MPQQRHNIVLQVAYDGLCYHGWQKTAEWIIVNIAMRKLLLFSILLLPAPSHAKTIAAARDAIVKATMTYLNIPYLWGGTHPKTGLDCSAFVGQVYADAGLRLPRVSQDQFKAAKGVLPKEVLPGDLIFFNMKHPGSHEVNHIGVYVGRGLFVHASVTHGVHVENIAKPYYSSRMIGILKYSGF